MANQHYDLIIAGDAPGAQMAGILLARAGMRILHLHGQGWPRQLLWHNSELLDDLLDQLQARHCLTAPVPLQLHHQSTCIELHGAIPWQDELRRELPESYQQISERLNQLEDWGKTIQGCLRRSGGSPAFNLRQRLAWRLIATRKGLPVGQLNGSLRAWLDDQTLQDEAGQLLAALFSAATLSNPDQLSLAEAALVWAQLQSRQTVAGSVLENLLSQRLTDNGATRRPFILLNGIQSIRSGVIQCQLGKETVQTERLFLAASPTAKIPGWPATALLPTGSPLWKLEKLSQSPSRLLAPRLLVSSSSGAFQLAIGHKQSQPEVYLRCSIDIDPAIDLADKLRELLGNLDFALPAQIPGSAISAGSGSFREQGAIALGKGLYLACANQLYPNLGLLGEALLATTLSQLKPKGRKS